MRAQIKERFIALVDFLGQALGPNYEIVLQELDVEPKGIIAIANNQISGRQVGGHPTGIALKMIMEKRYQQTDSVLNYVGILDNGKIVRSSTFFIKEEGQLLGMLCINFDSSCLQEFSDNMLRLFHPDTFLEKNGLLSNQGIVNPEHYIDQNNSVEYFQKDTESLLQEIMEKSLNEIKKPVSHFGPKDRQLLTQILYQHGMFKIKDSIQYVAKYLNCSTVSIYRYLQKIESED